MEERQPETRAYDPAYETVDLRPYIEALFEWWWLIALCAVLAGAAAFLVSVLQPPEYEAVARVVSLKSQAEISLGSNIKTITDAGDDLSEAVRGLSERQIAQRLNSLVGMVNNGAIAQQVVDELADVLDAEEERDPSFLLGLVEGQVLEMERGEFTPSDTIEIVVTYDDPQKAALIANAWGRHYETYVNQIYGEASVAPFTDISQQVVEAEVDYERAKDALLAFLGEDYVVSELQRQIEEEQAIIDSLRTGRQTALSMLANEEVASKQKLIRAYFDDDIRDLLSALNRKQKLENLLEEAYLMREQLNGGQDASAASTGLALLALKSRVFSTVDALPFGKLDLQVDSLASLNPQQDAVGQLADLNALITALEEDVVSLEALIEERSADLDQTQLSQRAGKAVDDLLQMNVYEDLILTSVAEAPLSQEIARREANVREFEVAIAQLNSRKRTLEKDRDLAWQTYDALLSKQQEIDVALWVKGTEVRFASPAVPPRKPVGSGTVRNTALAGVVGLMLGAGFAFFAEYMDIEPQGILSRRKASPGL